MHFIIRTTIRIILERSGVHDLLGRRYAGASVAAVPRAPSGRPADVLLPGQALKSARLPFDKICLFFHIKF